MSDNNDEEYDQNDDYGSYDDYAQNLSNAASQAVSNDKSSAVSDPAAEAASKDESDCGNYDDYVNKSNAFGNDDGITPDEAGYEHSDDPSTVPGKTNSSLPGNSGVTDKSLVEPSSNNESADAISDALGDSDAGSGSSLLSEGAATGPTGYSDVARGGLQGVKAAAGNAVGGIKNAITGGLGSMISALKGTAGKAKSGVDNISSNLGVPAKAVASVISLVAGGGVVSIYSLFFSSGMDVAKYSDYSNCNRLEQITDYTAQNGAGDHWQLSSAQGVAKSIYTALSSKSDFTFDSAEWEGIDSDGLIGKWNTTTVTNQGFGFSDEVIAGMLANAYAESKIRPDCYEMDYLVHDLNETDSDGNLVHSVNDADNDFILSRNHHSNWDNYCTRMFELYSADGMSINEDAYKYDSKAGMSMFSEHAVSGITGLYPGVGLWQWTGQRAYDLGRFANIQPDPKDTDRDNMNDAMYTTDLQLAYLYLENFGSFPQGGVLEWGRSQTYNYTGSLGADDGTAYKNLSYGIGGGDGTTDGTKFQGEDANIDAGDNVFKGQSGDEITDDDKWSSSKGDNTTNRFPKFVVNCDGNITVGDGSGDEAGNQSDNTGNIASGHWKDYGDSIGTLMTDGEDNQVMERFACSSEDEANESMNAQINLATDADGKEDKGYWSETANDEYAGGVANYKLTSKSRQGTEIREGREFNDKEIELLKSLYTVSEYSSYDEENDQWYHIVSLTLKSDSTADTGSTTEWKALHSDMASTDKNNVNAKYIARDLKVAAGAEAATECAKQFYTCWEGGPDDAALIKSHTKMAGSFYMLMQTDGWESSDEYAHSVLNMVDSNLNEADLQGMYQSYQNLGCDEATVEMDGIAGAAVSWAWPKGTDWYDINDESTMDGGGDAYKQTKCTSLYCAVKDLVEPGDTSFYSSCCRGVSTAVRAAGADDNIPLGGAAAILSYCSSNPDKWENLGFVTSTSFIDTLQPGDLLLSKHHVIIFVGPDLPLEKWSAGTGELTDCKHAIVHASRSGTLDHSRGPRCDNSCDYLVSDLDSGWQAFRCTGYESSSKWKAIVDAANLDGLKDGSENNH